MIPTQYRTKISHLLSYPAGAKEISEALVQVPQYSQLILRFYFWHDWNIRRGRYEFLRVEYRNYSEQQWTKSTLYKRTEQYQWEIVVQPVPRIHRNRIHSFIQTEALTAIRDWLVHSDKSDRQGTKGLAYFYEESLDTFQKEEADRLEPIRL